MGQGSLLLWGHRYSLPQPGCSLQSVCCPSIPLLTFHPTLAKDYQTPNPIYHLFFEKGKTAVSMYLILLPSEMRLLAGLVTHLLVQSHVEPPRAEEWEWAQKNRRRKQHSLLSCSLAMELIIPCIWLSLAVPLPNAFCFVVLWTKEFLLKASDKCTDPMLKPEREAAVCLEIQLASA